MAGSPLVNGEFRIGFSARNKEKSKLAYRILTVSRVKLRRRDQDCRESILFSPTNHFLLAQTSGFGIFGLSAKRSRPLEGVKSFLLQGSLGLRSPKGGQLGCQGWTLRAGFVCFLELVRAVRTFAWIGGGGTVRGLLGNIGFQLVLPGG